MSEAALQPVPPSVPAPGPAARLGVRRLALTEFRNYRSARLALDARPVVLTGPNGAGKTNLLEALSLLAPGRGLRRARLGELVCRHAPGHAGWAVAVSLDRADGPVDIGTGQTPADNGAKEDRRVVRVDGANVRGQAELARRVGVLWLTPEMDRLFLDGAGARRRFLDRMVYGFEPDHVGRIAAYDHAMRERNRLLREGRRDEAWLGALEETMAAKGAAVAASRRAFAQRLHDALARATGPFPRAGIALRGTVESWLDDGPALAAEERLGALLRRNRAGDAHMGRAADGVHRSDLSVHHLANGMPAAQCSTGEQKALLISLILADARLRAAARAGPLLLLLDEVIAHLDEDRRAALLEEICDLDAQSWITATDAAMFTGLGGRVQRFRVADAVLAPQ